MAALNATLYAVFGYMTFLGIFAPIVGIVRFWGPAVVIPADLQPFLEEWLVVLVLRLASS